MEFNLAIKGKQLLAMAFVLTAIFGIAFVVANPGKILNFAAPAPTSIPNPGHSSTDVVVNVSGIAPCSGDISLQDAIDNHCIGGGSSGGGFGDWVDMTAAASGGATQGPATTDGFVLAYTSAGADDWLLGYTDSANPPTTLRSKDYQGWGGGSVGLPTMPVKKNDYWKVVIIERGGSFDTKIYWLPVGN